MIKPVTMYTVLCDCCGKDAFEDCEQGVAWTDSSSAIQLAEESGWETEDGKNYCEDCQHWTEEGERVYKKKNKDL